MGIAKKTDGRYVVGVGVDNANDYRGSAAYRDIYIQLTSSGATAKSEEYLTFLKDYGFHANASGEPIMPPSVNVWISNNGVTTAVEADDVSIDGNNYTICGIKWNGSTWDYSGAGQGKSGSGLPSYTSADNGKVLTIDEGEPKWEAVGGYIYTASSTFQSGIMGLLQTAVTDIATNNKTFSFAAGIILSDEDAAAVSEMGTNPARARILRAINQDFAVVRSDGQSITVVLPYYEQQISAQLRYYLSISFTLGAGSKTCDVRVSVLGHS